MHIDKLIAATKDVGGIPVARLLPQTGVRTIGAWCFLDHAGPARFSETSLGMQVGAHPHTNLQTFTWMLEGEVWHQDSLGSRQLIRPKQVNLMTAGTGNQHGISHTEQTPEGMKDLHAVQLWIALPMNQDIKPNFEHYPKLPEWEADGVRYILTTGTFQNHTAPTTQFSPLLGVDMQFDQAQTVQIPVQQNWQYGVLVLKGKAVIEGAEYGADELARVQQCEGHSQFSVQAEAGSHLMLLGGEPLPHPTLVWWNFVADTQEALQQAITDWNNGHDRFGHIDLAGTTLKRLPAPELRAKLK